jgi:ACS family D-galactonate transporter-like MFS transporter
MVVLIVVSVAINYIDRGNLSIAAPLLKAEMNISAAQLGMLLSAFFWTYAVFQLVSGWLVDRFDVSWVMVTGFVAWSLATAATGLIHSFVMLFALRLLLGIGESVAYPCYAKIFVAHLDEEKRGVANALVDAGSKCGPALGTLVGGLFVAQFGWRPFFLALGLGALVWVPLWLKWMPRGRTAIAAHDSAAAPSFGEILRHRAIWPTFTGHFCGNYFYYFLLTWLPYYLVQERHFSMATMATIGSLPPLCSAAATMVAGTLSYRALQAGVSVTRVRKTCTVSGLAGATVVLLVPAVSSTTTAMIILMVASVAYGVFASSHWTITQTIAGPLAVGRWSGMQNFTGNLAGVVAPALTGFVVLSTGNFFWAFVAVGVVVLIGALGYLVGLGEVAPATWSTTAPRIVPAVPVRAAS